MTASTDIEGLIARRPVIETFAINPVGEGNIVVEGGDRFAHERDLAKVMKWTHAAASLITQQAAEIAGLRRDVAIVDGLRRAAEARAEAAEREIATLREKVRVMGEALEPFAKVDPMNVWDGDDNDETISAEPLLSVNDFRRAARASDASTSGDEIALQLRGANAVITAIERAIPDWRSYRDLVDAVECKLAERRP